MKQLYTSILSISIAASATAQLSGTYTVGGSAPDYASLTLAVNALVAQGANGNVTFDIRPGDYDAQYGIGAITGNPGTITFRNSSNGAQAVNLRFDASGDTDNHIFLVDGTPDVAFEKLTFRPLDAEYARAVVFQNAIESLRIEQCIFHGSTYADGSGYFRRILVHCDQLSQAQVPDPQQVHIIDNSFFNGNTAIELNFFGMRGARSEGLLITGNELLQQIGTGVYVNNAVGEIRGNLIRTSVGNWFVGIRTAYFDNGSSIWGNRVEAYATNGCTGLEVSNTQGTTGNVIANNMAYCSGTGEVWGLAVFNLWGMLIAHNSVLIEDGVGEDSFAFYHLSSFTDGQDAIVRNNIFANNTGGPAYYVEVPGNVDEEDHNCLFTTGNVLSQEGSALHTDLAEHQNGTGGGVGDVEMDPVFPAQPDLEMHGCVLDDLGIFIPAVIVDINGDDRADPACDMGAHEFDANIGVDAVQAPTIVITPADLPYELGLNASFNSYQWSTGATTPTTTISAGGNYDCLVQDVNGCMLDIGITVMVDVGTAIGEVNAPGLMIYPNPAHDRLWLSGLRTGHMVEVLDLHGRPVLTTRPAGHGVDVALLAPGCYVLRTAGRVVPFIKQ